MQVRTKGHILVNGEKMMKSELWGKADHFVVFLSLLMLANEDGCIDDATIDEIVEVAVVPTLKGFEAVQWLSSKGFIEIKGEFKVLKPVKIRIVDWLDWVPECSEEDMPDG